MYVKISQVQQAPSGGGGEVQSERHIEQRVRPGDTREVIRPNIAYAEKITFRGS
jgi:hypothetical protein